MLPDYQISQEDNIVVIVLNQNISFQTMCDIWDTILTCRTRQKRLWDLTRYTGSFSQDELIEFAKYANDSLAEKSYSAMVASTDLLYGVMRQHQVFRQRDRNTTVNVFRDIRDAKKWLTEV